jgi:pimeloyl-ACP methyl ester carboxylesterase
MSARLEPRTVDLASGFRIEYLEVGDGPPVVYFHGAGGVLGNAAFIPALGQRYRVLAPARPGHRSRLARSMRSGPEFSS